MTGDWATQILVAVGGPGNVTHLTHCAVRLRFVLADLGQVQEAALNALPEVLLVIRQSGQLQLALGVPVPAAYAEIARLLDEAAAPAGMTGMTGMGVSPGVGTGPIARLGTPPRPPTQEQPGCDLATELARVTAALAEVAEDLEARATRLDPDGEAAAVLSATAMMARDPGLVMAVTDRLKAGRPTLASLDEATEAFCDLLIASGGYLAQRATDLRDVRDRALALLLGEPMPGIPHPGHPYVLVAHDLAPSDTAALDPAEVLAILTEEGGPTSHTAILAKGLGIPAVVRCAGASSLAEGTLVVVDGSAGTVICDPDEQALASAAAHRAAHATLAAACSGPGATADGVRVALLANIATVEDATRAARLAGEGVGLFRTEGLYLDRTTAPSAAEQESAYRQVFAAFGSQRIVVRTLDAGADKPLAFVDVAAEANPALGVRGLRVAGRHPELLADPTGGSRPGGSERRDDGGRVGDGADGVDPRRGSRVRRPRPSPRPRHRRRHDRGALRRAARPRVAARGRLRLYRHQRPRPVHLRRRPPVRRPRRPAGSLATGPAGSHRGCRAGRSRHRDPGRRLRRGCRRPLLACVLVGLGVRSLSMAPGLIPAVHAALGAHTLSDCQAMAAEARHAPDARTARTRVLRLHR